MSESASWKTLETDSGFRESPYATEIVPDPAHDLNAYLDHRAVASPFSFVEIGHREYPISPYIPDLQGGRTYIGIEAWMRDRSPYRGYEDIAEKLRRDALGTTAAYIRTILSGEIRYKPDDEYLNHSWYAGEYDPECILPDSVADELFMGNVLCDPQQGWSEDTDKDRLLTEAARLLTPNGILVLRATMTSGVAQISRGRYVQAGLNPVGYYSPVMTDAWRRLEETYRGRVSRTYFSNDHYLFLEPVTV